MFDPVKLRALADRAASIQADAGALRDDLDALLPLAVSPEALADIARWPQRDQECRQHLLHALLHLSRATLSLGVATIGLGDAATGIEI